MAENKKSPEKGEDAELNAKERAKKLVALIAATIDEAEAASKKAKRSPTVRPETLEHYVGWVRRQMKAVRQDRELSAKEISALLAAVGQKIEHQAVGEKFTKGTLQFAYALMLLYQLGERTIRIPSPDEAKKAHDLEFPEKAVKRKR